MENTEPIFFNRDLSWIEFNGRVLSEAMRPDLPPLDRFKFLSIVSSNFDEFFMVRVAAMKRALKSRFWNDPSGLNIEDQLKETSEKARAIIERQYTCLRDEVLPALAREGLELVRPGGYTAVQKTYLESLFFRELDPVLTPLRVEGEDGLPSTESLKLFVVFMLVKEDSADPDQGDYMALVQVPSSLDRVVWLPEEGGIKNRWTLLEDVIISWGTHLFQGYDVRESMVFKVNRDADFSVDEQRDEDFVEAMEEVLINREKSMPVRMVCSSESPYLRKELTRRLGLEENDIYEIEGPLDLRTLSELVNVSGFDRLRSKIWKNYWNPEFPEDEPLWDRICQGDVIIHLPYNSFDPVLRFFQDAATDPSVISIKTALYRTSGDSPVVKALELAALNGKQVTAVVELKARFDESRNISWANRLEKAGVIVVYGLARLKVHAKATLIIRRESSGIKRYVYMSTGNYNDKTAKQYGDIGLFTSQEDIGYDVSMLFNMITGYSTIQGTRRLVIAPTAFKQRLLSLIDRETNRSSQESPGKIMAKMNALADTDVIKALYRASQGGVKILLNVRGICMLVPGVPGLSENIRVVSIVDHYLEHSRIFYFDNGGADEVYLSSADWMTRNLERRVELMFPVLQGDLKKKVTRILETYFLDNCQSHLLQSNGEWKRLTPSGKDAPFRAQEYFYNKAREEAHKLWTPKQEFTVRRSPPGERI
ncbi:polyphosphate kinase 1 [Breznakiella homolactica]|uniref:Polyphosphate kinase n=1 Tax=Breznakiella homolactica TaxID=2798577 RepID=A0A7T8BCQ3_9SPIR|nr:polyphosphate kinase 1 [Breznakiella homolactica]QQO10503.1 polyphosphate kinase 1 [Breznakiella homolactica]